MRWVTLGDYIEQCDIRNSTGHAYPVLGVNRNKEFMPTVANMDDVDTKKYKIISKRQFVFSGMQTGRDVCIRIGLYEKETPAVMSPAYTIFTIKDPTELLPEFLFLYFNRSEMDRYGWFISDSSIRSNLDWNRFLEIQIPLPDIDEQRKIVSVWKGLRDLKVQNEAIAGPLFELCQSYLKQLKEEYEPTEIGPYIEEVNERNISKIYSEDNVRGISIQKEFIATKANLDGVSLSSYKVVEQNNFSFNPNTARMGEKICVSLNTSDIPYLVSAIYPVFKIINTNKLLPEYLMLWYKRPEFDRYSRFNSWGSAREVFNYSDMCRVQIPIPSLEKQRAIVNIYNCAKEAKDIADKTEQLIKDICPALMRQVIGETS